MTTTNCQVCGEGAMIYCDSCKVNVVHRKCIERISRDFKNKPWLCALCEEIDHTQKFRVVEEKQRRKKALMDEKNIKSRMGDLDTKKVNSSSIQKSSGLKLNEPSSSMAKIASNVAEHDSSANMQRKVTPRGSGEKLGSSNTRTLLGSRTDKSNASQLPRDVRQTSSKKTESSTSGHRGNFREPVWMGSLSFNLPRFRKGVNVVAHVASLAWSEVHEKAKSIPRYLYFEVFHKSDICPENILEFEGLLYLFSDGGSDDKEFDGLVSKMVDALAGKVVLDNTELILFTSHLLPRKYLRIKSKPYLCCGYRRKQAYPRKRNAEKQ